MNIDLNLYSRLMEAVYGTALDDNRWSDVFSLLKDATGVEHLVLHGYDNSLQAKSVAALHGYDPSVMRPFEEYYWSINSWLPGLSTAPVGKGVAAEVFCPEETLRKSEFYNDWVRHIDDLGTGGGIVLFRDENRFLSLSGNISFKHRDALQSQWVDMLNVLSPHLRQAFEMRRQLAGRQLTDASYLTALDAVGNAVFLLNSKGRIVYSNPAAQTILDAGRLVGLDSKANLRVFEPKAARALNKALYEISLNFAPVSPCQFVVETRGGGSKSIANLAPFSPDPTSVDRFAAFAGGDLPIAILTITLPRKVKQPATDMMRALFGLTPAETAWHLHSVRAKIWPDMRIAETSASTLSETSWREFLKRPARGARPSWYWLFQNIFSFRSRMAGIWTLFNSPR